LGSSSSLMVDSWILKMSCINVIFDLNQVLVATKFQAY
jgi:hypothetical protein